MSNHSVRRARVPHLIHRLAVPILLFYPFLQKHFAKGVLIGSVKG